MINLYRKYRPKNFREIVGQKEIKDILISEIKNKRVSHAYLFAGMRGCGKTTTARILAKSLNCLSPIDSYEPCGECDNCKAIENGSFPDVVEMDAASNRGIDEIRSIKEGVNFVPAVGKYKVYIIDEVHMLTQQAFNALLKTLEEPPEHTVFILATTEINKVPQTIISRCQVLSFKPHGVDDVIENLSNICKKEGYSYEDQALEIIAKKGEGSMRDSIGILEQVAIFSKGKINKTDVLDLLGDVEDQILDDFIFNIINLNKINVKKIIDQVYMSGKNMEIFLKDLIYRINERIESGEDLYKILVFFVNAYKDINYFFDKNIFMKAKSFELIDILGDIPSNNGSSIKRIKETVKLEDTVTENIENVKSFVNEDVRISKDTDSDTLEKIVIKDKNVENVDSEPAKELVNKNVGNIDDSIVSEGHKQKNLDSESKIDKRKNEVNNQVHSKDNDYPEYWANFIENLKKANIALFTLLSKANVRFYDDKVILEYPSDEDFSYQTISSRLDDVKRIFSKFGLNKDIVVLKTDEEIEKMPDEIKDILKLFGGTVEKR
jgi:DNA polymerase-3 subunit gamma/tau